VQSLGILVSTEVLRSKPPFWSFYLSHPMEINLCLWWDGDPRAPRGSDDRFDLSLMPATRKVLDPQGRNLNLTSFNEALVEHFPSPRGPLARLARAIPDRRQDH
jgi:hypothetical protein